MSPVFSFAVLTKEIRMGRNFGAVGFSSNGPALLLLVSLSIVACTKQPAADPVDASGTDKKYPSTEIWKTLTKIDPKTSIPTKEIEGVWEGSRGSRVHCRQRS